MFKIFKRYRWYVLIILIAVLWIMGFRSLTFVMPGVHSQQVGDAQILSADSMSSREVLAQIDDDAVSQRGNEETDTMSGSRSNADQNSDSCQDEKRSKVEDWYRKATTEKKQEFQDTTKTVTSDSAQNGHSNLSKDLDKLDSIYIQKLKAIGCSTTAQ